MKRASYRDGVRWIADNDSAGEDRPGDPEAEHNAAYYVSSLLLADLFGVEPERVGRDVMRERQKTEDRKR